METKKRDEMIDKFIRRQAVIKDKYKNISEAPKSIQEEYYSLNTLVDSLKSSRREIWGQTIASDGTEIDKFVEKKYEEALANYSRYNDENSQYISAEEEANFEFPKIDFDEMSERAKGIKTEEDYISLNEEIMNLNNQILPEDMTRKLNKIQNTAAQTLQVAKEEMEKSAEETLPVVNERRQSKIFSKIKETISKIKMAYEKRRAKSKKENSYEHRQESSYEHIRKYGQPGQIIMKDGLISGVIAENGMVVGSAKSDLEVEDEPLTKGSDFTKSLDALADKLAKERATDGEFKKYMDNEKGKESKEVGEKEK